MSKLLSALLFSFTIISANANGINAYSRDSLQTIFGSSYRDLNDNLTNDDFMLYIQSFGFTLANINELGTIEWSNPESTIAGKITIITKNQEGDMICKSFIHSIRLNNKIYEGDGVGCFSSGQWNIKKL